jgi:hypothetical protein
VIGQSTIALARSVGTVAALADITSSALSKLDGEASVLVQAEATPSLLASIRASLAVIGSSDAGMVGDALAVMNGAIPITASTSKAATVMAAVAVAANTAALVMQQSLDKMTARGAAPVVIQTVTEVVETCRLVADQATQAFVAVEPISEHVAQEHAAALALAQAWGDRLRSGDGGGGDGCWLLARDIRSLGGAGRHLHGRIGHGRRQFQRRDGRGCRDRGRIGGHRHVRMAQPDRVDDRSRGDGCRRRHDGHDRRRGDRGGGAGGCGACDAGRGGRRDRCGDRHDPRGGLRAGDRLGLHDLVGRRVR